MALHCEVSKHNIDADATPQLHDSTFYHCMAGKRAAVTVTMKSVEPVRNTEKRLHTAQNSSRLHDINFTEMEDFVVEIYNNSKTSSYSCFSRWPRDIYKADHTCIWHAFGLSDYFLGRRFPVQTRDFFLINYQMRKTFLLKLISVDAGGDPFPGVCMREIPSLLKKGYRMPCPKFVSPKL